MGKIYTPMKKLKDLIPKYKLKKGGLFGGDILGTSLRDLGTGIKDNLGGLKTQIGGFTPSNIADRQDSFNEKTKNNFKLGSLGNSFRGEGLDDTLYNTFDTTRGEVYDAATNMAMDAAKVGIDYGLAPISVPVSVLTGKSLTDNFGWDYQSKAGKAVAAPLSQVYTGVNKAIAPMVANVFAPGSGAAVSAAQSATPGIIDSVTNPEEDINSPQYAKTGGTALKTLINVEKNELEVEIDPKTGLPVVVKDFKDKPPHPENDDMINLKGNTRAKLGNVIIPKDMRKEYLSSNQEGQMEIIHELMEQTNESMKMQEGGGVATLTDPVTGKQTKTYSTPLSNFLPPSNKPLYDIPKGEIVDGVDRGMVDRTEAIIRPTQTRLWQTREMIDKLAPFDPTKTTLVANKKGKMESQQTIPKKLTSAIGGYITPQMKNYQRVLTAELQKKAGVGNQITTQFLTPEEAQKALTSANAGSYKDYIDFFNTYQKYRGKSSSSGIPLKDVSGSKNPAEELYGIRHVRLFTPQNVVPVTNNTPNTRKKGGMVSLKDCVKRYDQPPYEVGVQEKYNFEGENSSENPNNSPNFYSSQGTGLYNTPMYDAMSNEVTPNADVEETETVDSNGDSSFNMGSLAALGANAGTIGMGLNQSRKAGKALKEVPNYSIDPLFKQGYEWAINNARQLAGTSKAAAGYGFNSAQRAQFNSNLAQQNNTAFQNAVARSGGNLSKAINAAINSQNISGQNQFAVNDANLQNQKQMYADKTGTSLGELQMRYGNATQTQKNLASQKEIMDRLRLEQAYGKAKSQGDTNLANAGNSLGSLLPLLSKMA